jgi:hypothetical protein
MKPMRAMALMMVLLVGCRTSEFAMSAKPMLRTEMFFGLSRPDGGVVSDQEWQAFVDETITPRFPDGFTIVDGIGQWREASGHIAHERSKILLILHPRDQTTTTKLDEIRTEYKQRFKQEAVIRETSETKVSF